MSSGLPLMEIGNCLYSASHKKNDALKSYEDLVLNSRKPTIPTPFNLNSARSNQNSKKTTDSFYKIQKKYSISPTLKKNFYSGLSLDKTNSISPLNTHKQQKNTLRPKVSLKLGLRKKYSESKLTEPGSITKEKFFNFKVSLKLTPRLNLNKESKWSPRLKLDDLANLK